MTRKLIVSLLLLFGSAAAALPGIDGRTAAR